MFDFFYQIGKDGLEHAVDAATLDRVATRFGWNREESASLHLLYWAEVGDTAPCGWTAPDGTDCTVGFVGR